MFSNRGPDKQGCTALFPHTIFHCLLNQTLYCWYVYSKESFSVRGLQLRILEHAKQPLSRALFKGILTADLLDVGKG